MVLFIRIGASLVNKRNSELFTSGKGGHCRVEKSVNEEALFPVPSLPPFHVNHRIARSIHLPLLHKKIRQLFIHNSSRNVHRIASKILIDLTFGSFIT
jgi:hypothetical protein